MSSIFKLSLLIIFLLIIRVNLHEGLSQRKKIILLGDSIIENRNYIDENKTLTSILKHKYNVLNLAEDGARINSINKQVNTRATCDTDCTIIISVGGNDILETVMEFNTIDLNKLFNRYITMLNHVMKVFNSKNIVLFNIYEPPSYIIRNVIPFVKQWNKKLKSFCSDQNIKMLDIAEFMNEESDFVNIIEPSEQGTKKIALHLLKLKL